MMLSAILFAIADCDLRTLRMIEPPPAVPYVVPASDVPYPNRSDGSVRLSVNHLGAMYGTLNGYLQRRFFPRWNESIPPDLADLTADDLPTCPFNAEGFGYDRKYHYPYFWAWLVPGNLGDYANPTNRDFSGDSLRFYRGAEFLDKDFSAKTASLVTGSFDVWSDVRRYWLAVLPDGVANFDTPKTQASSSSVEDSIAGFVVDDCAAQLSFSGESSPLFLGDLAFRSLLGSATPFSYHGYRELLDKDTGLLPEWAVKNLGYKGLPDFSLQYGDAASGGASPDGSSRSGASAADAFLGEGAWAGIDMADVSRVVSPRVWWGQFALANFVLSLMKVQFLGMAQADWASQMCPSSYAMEHWNSCPSVRYSRQTFSGSYRDNKTAACGGFTYNGFIPGSGFHFSVDWSEVNSAVDYETAAEETSLDPGEPQNCKSVAAGWYDTGGSVSYTVTTSMGVYYPDSLIDDPSVVQPDNPFAGEPESVFAMQWCVEGRYFNADTGQLVLYVVPGTDSLGNPLPGVQFSDGSTERLWRYTLLRSSGVSLPVAGFLSQSRKVSFKGSVPAARHAFIGPSHKESGAQKEPDQPDDKSLWPMTFHHELYSAGVVKTRINSFTTVGISANPAAAQSVAAGGEFPEAEAYASLAGVNGVNILMRHKTERNNISSPGAWYSAWNSVCDMTSITNDIAAITARWREAYASQTGSSASSDEAEREWALQLNLPTVDAAKDVSDRAKKQLFDDAWKRCTLNRHSAYLVDGGFMSGFTGVSFDIGEGYTNMVVNGSVGAFSFSFGDSEKLKDTERRSSITVGYEKRSLPFAYWNFPSINGND